MEAPAAKRPRVTAPPAALPSFERIRQCGRGTQARIMLARRPSDRLGSLAQQPLFAIKAYRGADVRRSAADVAQLCTERAALIALAAHPFAVTLRAAWWDPAARSGEGEACLACDYAKGGDLLEQLQKCPRGRGLELPRARLYAAQLLLVLGELHAQGFLYRDLKPENVLLDEAGHVQLCDFGCAHEGLQAEEFVGTPSYCAPEVLRAQSGPEAYGAAADAWSFGILLYEMLVGRVPYLGEEAPQVLARQGKSDGPPAHRALADAPDAVELLGGLLCKSATERTTLAQAQQHAFFGSLDFGEVRARRVAAPFKPRVRRGSGALASAAALLAAAGGSSGSEESESESESEGEGAEPPVAGAILQEFLYVQ